VLLGAIFFHMLAEIGRLLPCPGFRSSTKKAGSEVRSWSSEGVQLCCFKLFLGFRKSLRSSSPSARSTRRSMSAQRHKAIAFAAEGLRLALPVDRNCGIRANPTLFRRGSGDEPYTWAMGPAI
jgi:hypothetical protein